MMRITQKALTVSDWIYRLLLIAYPAPFRREYDIHMAQVFRDECRARLECNGLIGLSQLWLHTLCDWLKTVFEQHVEEIFHMSGQKWIIRLGALTALVGGILGLYLLIQGPNSYGNYGWHGWLAPVAAALFALGLGGATAAHKKQLSSLGWFGIVITIVGLLLMGMGYASDAMWGFIFIGPLLIVPIGSIMLGISIYQSVSSPTWWRFFPFVVGAIAVFGFGVELLEEFTGNSAPDRGLQLAEALFSLAWIGLGADLWLNYGSLPDDPQLTA
jgi:hypothetical protein